MRVNLWMKRDFVDLIFGIQMLRLGILQVGFRAFR